MNWKSEPESRTVSGGGFHADMSAMTLDNPLAQRQANARSPMRSVKPLEDLKDPPMILRRDADSLITDRKSPAKAFFDNADMDVRPRWREFHRIREQIPKHLLEMYG